MAAGSQNNAHFKYAMELENVNLFAVAVEAARRGLFMLPKWKRKESRGEAAHTVTTFVFRLRNEQVPQKTTTAAAIAVYETAKCTDTHTDCTTCMLIRVCVCV